MGKNIKMENDPPRKRGRPAGKNRTPLSLEERRARNAQYERERRMETSEAMSELADAAGCDPGISNCDLIATVLHFLQRTSEINKTESLDSLRRCNANLMQQIESLEACLASDPALAGLLSCDDEDSDSTAMRTHTNANGRKKIKREDSTLSNVATPDKIGQGIKSRCRIRPKKNSTLQSFKTEAEQAPNSSPLLTFKTDIHDMPMEQPPLVPDFEIPSPSCPGFYENVTMDYAGAAPTDSQDFEQLESLEPSWNEVPIKEANDGVTDSYAMHWRAEDFVLEYL